MLRLLLLLGLVFLLAGGGVGTWWFGIKGEPIPGLPTQTESARQAAAEQRLSKLPSEFVEMKPLSIPVMQEGQVTKLLTVVVNLEVAGQKGLEAVAANRTVLRDAMLSELHGLYALDFVRENENQMTLVKKRLLKRGQAVLGKKLRGLYIKAIQGREVSQKS